MKIFKTVENEISSYINNTIELSPGVSFSQYTLVNKILRFANKVYAGGEFDSQGNKKYWFDIITPNIDSEVKNIDFDTKNISVYSESPEDAGPLFILNIALVDWMRDNKQGKEINNSVEEGTGLGNLVWKKVKGGYELFDPKNFYVINQLARTLNDTPVVERHVLTQSELRAKKGAWDSDAIEEAIKQCKNKSFSSTKDGALNLDAEIPYYEVYERNGEISLAELKEARGENYKENDRDVFVLAKVVLIGLEGTTDKEGRKFVLFADEIPEMPYKEYHRGKYSGKWWREGIYEIMFDLQVRANQIGNEIASGLKWASKTIFRSSTPTVFENVLTDLNNGDIIKSDDLSQVTTRMEGFDQLVADWNRVVDLGRQLCNNSEVVTGGDTSAGMPFRLGALINQNANKLFVFIREKLAIAYSEIYQDWVLPDIINDISEKEYLRVAKGNKVFEDVARRMGEVEALRSGESIDDAVMRNMKANELFLKNNTKFNKIKPKVSIVIDGENVNMNKNMETISTLIQLESDPVRRSALIEIAAKWALPTIDFSLLPKGQEQDTPTRGVSIPSSNMDSGQLGQAII